ncbi:hypothetical protein K2173_007854 [Erythroxylum novogranatense]|uniref:Uncharacterized protein n=1 Tax=Erythroxylum novogranatense TaxID=1862640 RepID=A0AAV8S711_9ROSI|nr:hypothetical protein K2173_007854 [Erythroxylum novogranatense]
MVRHDPFKCLKHPQPPQVLTNSTTGRDEEAIVIQGPRDTAPSRLVVISSNDYEQWKEHPSNHYKVQNQTSSSRYSPLTNLTLMDAGSFGPLEPPSRRTPSGMGLRFNVNELLDSGMQAVSSSAGIKRTPRAASKGKAKFGSRALQNIRGPTSDPKKMGFEGTLEIQLAPTDKEHHLKKNIPSHTKMICDCQAIEGTGMAAEDSLPRQEGPDKREGPPRDNGKVNMIPLTDPPEKVPEALPRTLMKHKGWAF